MAEETKDLAKKGLAYARGAYNYVEGAVQILMGAFICFYGGTMVEWTIRCLLFFGITVVLFMGFTVVNDATEMWPAFA